MKIIVSQLIFILREMFKAILFMPHRLLVVVVVVAARNHEIITTFIKLISGKNSTLKTSFRNKISQFRLFRPFESLLSLLGAGVCLNSLHFLLLIRMQRIWYLITMRSFHIGIEMVGTRRGYNAFFVLL